MWLHLHPVGRGRENEDVQGSGQTKRRQLSEGQATVKENECKVNEATEGEGSQLETTTYFNAEEAQPDSLMVEDDKPHGDLAHCCLVVSTALTIDLRLRVNQRTSGGTA